MNESGGCGLSVIAWTIVVWLLAAIVFPGWPFLMWLLVWIFPPALLVPILSAVFA